MQVKIVISVGEQYLASATVETPCFVGRSKEAELCVPHPAISRKHCELFEESGKLYLRDNDSTNGTLFMGRFIDDRVAVTQGDEFVIDDLLFRLVPLTYSMPGERKLEAIIDGISDSTMMIPLERFKASSEEEKRASILITGDCFSE